MDFQRIMQQVQAQRNQFADAHAVAAARADTLADQVEKLKAQLADAGEKLAAANARVDELEAEKDDVIVGMEDFEVPAEPEA